MPKLNIIYWTMSGNTRIMADCLAEGAKQSGASVQTSEVTQITPQDALDCDLLALGCPAMGAEALEETEFEPFFVKLLPNLAGRKLALFGSYGWGGGEWLRLWQERARQAGVNLYQHPNLANGLAVCGRPDANGLQLCLDFGMGFAKF